MANGRPPDDESGRSSRRRRAPSANAGGLAALGSQMRSGAPPGAVANESGLKSLGDTIKRSGGRRRSGKAKWSSRRKIVTVLSSLIVLALVITGGGLYYFNHVLGSLTNLNIPDETAVKNGAPFTILVIGSDSRVGQNSSYFGSSSAVTGQRSDVLQLWRVTPSSSSIQIISIPRDTVVSMIGADVNQFGRYNRINSSFNTGPNQLVKTIQANFGLPINHVVELDFSGFENAVTALGGVYLNFNYPAKDAYSGLNITTPGCQLVTGFQALAVARARHYEYYKNGYWQYDGTSDFGRIQRQDAFIRALITAAKSKETDPLAAIHFLSSLHEGLSLDHGFSSSEVIGLFETYHSFNPAGLVAQTLPTVAANGFGSLGDVLTVDQPAGEQMLSNVFGSDLGTPNSPPPDSAGNPNPPPVVTPTTAAPPVAGAPSGTTTPTTTPPEPYNPTPCSPA